MGRATYCSATVSHSPASAGDIRWRYRCNRPVTVQRTAKNIRKLPTSYFTKILYNITKIITPVTETYIQMGNV